MSGADVAAFFIGMGIGACFVGLVMYFVTFIAERWW